MSDYAVAEALRKVAEAIQKNAEAQITAAKIHANTQAKVHGFTRPYTSRETGEY